MDLNMFISRNALTTFYESNYCLGSFLCLFYVMDAYQLLKETNFKVNYAISIPLSLFSILIIVFRLHKP
ncbi:hypothetical protein RIF29_28543 [Crotalaria pallida]|uniref:Uncharacterized protein n=1 Tax=Crotalaria pallida TaxID=3830 RepID=A0AAN9EDV3_CROPI